MTDTIDELTRRCDRWIDVERLLFETLGRWAIAVPEPAVKRALATWCHRHAWHASLWDERRPTHRGGSRVDEPDGDDWLAPLRAVLAPDGVAEHADSADKLVALVDVILPALDAAHADHVRGCDDALDSPTARVLDLIRADLSAERAEFSRLRHQKWSPDDHSGDVNGRGHAT